MDSSETPLNVTVDNVTNDHRTETSSGTPSLTSFGDYFSRPTMSSLMDNETFKGTTAFSASSFWDFTHGNFWDNETHSDAMETSMASSFSFLNTLDNETSVNAMESVSTASSSLITTLDNDTYSNATGSVPATYRTTVVIQVILMPIVMSGNTLILCAIKRSKSLHKVSYYLMGNLAVADILFGFSIFIRNIFALQNKLDMWACLLTNALTVLSAESSLTGILLLCLQSFLSVRFSILFKTGFTNRVAGSLVALMWTFNSIIATLAIVLADTSMELPVNQCYVASQYYSRTFTGIMSVATCGTMILLVTFQLLTIATIEKQSKQLLSQQSSSNEGTGSTRLSTVAKNAISIKRLRKTSQIVRIVGFVLGAAILLWGPYITGVAVYTFCPDRCGMENRTLMTLSIPVIFNSIANVFIYGVKSKEFRTAFARICHPSPRVEPSVTVTVTSSD